jgi:hypothetical protein
MKYMWNDANDFAHFRKCLYIRMSHFHGTRPDNQCRNMADALKHVGVRVLYLRHAVKYSTRTPVGFNASAMLWHWLYDAAWGLGRVALGHPYRLIDFRQLWSLMGKNYFWNKPPHTISAQCKTMKLNTCLWIRKATCE